MQHIKAAKWKGTLKGGTRGAAGRESVLSTKKVRRSRSRANRNSQHESGKTAEKDVLRSQRVRVKEQPKLAFNSRGNQIEIIQISARKKGARKPLQAAHARRA